MCIRTILYFRLDSRPMPRGFDLDAEIAYGSSVESFHAVTHVIKQYGIKLNEGGLFIVHL